MRYLVLSVFLFISTMLLAQVKDITPYLAAEEQFFDITGDNQGNLYIIKKKNYTGVAVLRWQGGGWKELIGYADKPVAVSALDDQLYLITEVPMSSYHYRLQRLSSTGWSVVPTEALDGSVINTMLLPNKQLVVRGKFKFAGGEHRFAMLNNGKWEPVPLPADKEIADIFTKYTSYAPQPDAQGVLYFYAWIGSATPGNEVVSWDGTNWKKMGLFGKYRVSDMAVAPNGNLYAGNASPAGLIEWNGSSWNLLTCNAKGYDGGALTATAVNESNEVFVAGNAKKKKDFIIYKYSQGQWQEFAKIPTGPVSSLYYNNGYLYVQAKDYKLYQVSGAGTPAQQKAATVFTPAYSDREREMEKIYNDYMGSVLSIWQPVTDAVKFFESSKDDDEKTVSIARTGMQSIATLNATLNGYLARIGQLNLGTNHRLSASMTTYLTSALKHNNTWNSVFSCYVKDDDNCMEAAKNQLPVVLKEFNDNTDTFYKVAKEYNK